MYYGMHSHQNYMSIVDFTIYFGEGYIHDGRVYSLSTYIHDGRVYI